jgi:hypothetical protein
MIQGESWERLKQLIAYMETTTDDQWLMDRVSSEGNKQNCCLGHVFFIGGDDETKCNEWWNWFENAVATEYLIFPVNDGRHRSCPPCSKGMGEHDAGVVSPDQQHSRYRQRLVCLGLRAG